MRPLKSSRRRARHLTKREATIWIHTEEGPDFLDEHIDKHASSCTCQMELFLALDRALRVKERSRRSWSATDYLEGLGDRFTARFMCPRDLFEVHAGMQGSKALREAVERHLRYCLNCNRELRAIVDTVSSISRAIPKVVGT